MPMDETSEDGLYRWTQWIFKEVRDSTTNELNVVRMGLHRYRSGYFALDGRTAIIFESFREHSGSDIPHSIGHLVPWLAELTRGTRTVERMMVRHIHIATKLAIIPSFKLTGLYNFGLLFGGSADFSKGTVFDSF